MGKKYFKKTERKNNNNKYTVINISREIKDTASVKHDYYVIFLKHRLESIYKSRIMVTELKEQHTHKKG